MVIMILLPSYHFQYVQGDARHATASDVQVVQQVFISLLLIVLVSAAVVIGLTLNLS